MKILFMCVANSARSQLAEALAKEIFGRTAWIESAGSDPKIVNPFAARVLKEVNIDISTHFSKSYDQLTTEFTNGLDYIITLCAEEVCPVVASKTAKRLHWPFPDPAGKEGVEEEQLARFRLARDNIKEAVSVFSKNVIRS